MGLFGFGKKKKDELLRLQKIVVKNAPNKLVMSEKQLRSAAQRLAINDLRIINDCAAIVQKTTKPDVFFSRLALLGEKSFELASIEKYISFSGASPSAAFKEYIDNTQVCIRMFIFRYHSEAGAKASTLKTSSGQIGKYKKYYDELKQYYNRMNSENIAIADTKFTDSIQLLENTNR